jgi:hypothetical protein
VRRLFLFVEIVLVLFERQLEFCSSRKLPYEDLQAYMTGRYYISPSKLYSIVRAYPGVGTGARGQVYDVPVVGDWVTIAVVAERSPIRVSRAPVHSRQVKPAMPMIRTLSPTHRSPIPTEARNREQEQGPAPPCGAQVRQSHADRFWRGR